MTRVRNLSERVLLQAGTCVLRGSKSTRVGLYGNWLCASGKGQLLVDGRIAWLRANESMHRARKDGHLGCSCVNACKLA